MNDYFVIKLLSDENLNFIKNKIQSLSENNWTSGIYSGASTTSIKKNLELSNLDILTELMSLIISDLNLNKDFSRICIPNGDYKYLLSKTTAGGYYNPHIDRHDVGTYSISLFISDLNEYEGGELCLYLNNEEIKFKLNSGEALVYRTGIHHRVNEVISGTRYVGVKWAESLINDDFIREIYSELDKIKIHPIYSNNFENVINDQNYILNYIKTKILSKYIK